MMSEITKGLLDLFINGDIDEFCCDDSEFDEVMEVINKHNIKTYQSSDSPHDVIIERMI